jgi:hypothetical protein
VFTYYQMLLKDQFFSDSKNAHRRGSVGLPDRNESKTQRLIYRYRGVATRNDQEWMCAVKDEERKIFVN